MLFTRLRPWRLSFAAIDVEVQHRDSTRPAASSSDRDDGGGRVCEHDRSELQDGRVVIVDIGVSGVRQQKANRVLLDHRLQRRRIGISEHSIVQRLARLENSRLRRVLQLGVIS